MNFGLQRVHSRVLEVNTVDGTAEVELTLDPSHPTVFVCAVPMELTAAGNALAITEGDTALRDHEGEYIDEYFKPITDFTDTRGNLEYFIQTSNNPTFVSVQTPSTWAAPQDIQYRAPTETLRIEVADIVDVEYYKVFVTQHYI